MHNLNLKHQLCLLCCFNIFHACLCYHLLSTISNYNLFYFYGAGSHCQGRLIIDFVECKSMNPVFPNGCYLMFKMKSCLVLVFKNCFLFLKTKNTKNLFGEGGVFLFFVFSVFSKTTFLRTIKRCFHCFFTVHRIDCFLCFLFLLFVFS